uniref:Transposase n=1 Tax=Ascaris lumbricoides TaxID=6252 RepID=A0A0M3IGS4_ASCLU
MEYHKGPRNTEYQLIKAKKALATREYFDADSRMKQLETDIKREMLAMRLLKEHRPIYPGEEEEVRPS